MTKEELHAANERLGAEIAALRELLTVIGDAKPPLPADSDDMRRYHFTGSYRIMMAANAAREAMRHIGSPAYLEIVHAHAIGLRGDISEPLRYTPVSAAPAPVIDVSEAAGMLAAAIITGTPVLVTDDEARWCPGTTFMEHEEVTLYCDRDAGHDGSHHAPGPDEGSEVAWSDEPASVTA